MGAVNYIAHATVVGFCALLLAVGTVHGATAGLPLPPPDTTMAPVTVPSPTVPSPVLPPPAVPPGTQPPAPILPPPTLPPPPVSIPTPAHGHPAVGDAFAGPCRTPTGFAGGDIVARHGAAFQPARRDAAGG